MIFTNTPVAGTIDPQSHFPRGSPVRLSQAPVLGVGKDKWSRI